VVGRLGDRIYVRAADDVNRAWHGVARTSRQPRIRA
jgi:hypothetical protein